MNAIAEAQKITAEAEQAKADLAVAMAAKQKQIVESVREQMREAEEAAARVAKAAEVEATRIRLAAHADAKKILAQAVNTKC